jgi:hypothetical protein
MKLFRERLLARLIERHAISHIPDTGKHRTHSYGFYASRVRASRREKEGPDLSASARSTRRTRSCAKAAEVPSRSWRTSPTSCPSGASWTIWI